MSRREQGATFAEAVRLHRGGAVVQAEALYREVLAATDRSHEAWHLLAVALSQQGRMDEAAHAAEQATTRQHRQARYWLTRGDIEAARDRQGEAQKHFGRAARLDPEVAGEAYFRLGCSLHRARMFREAATALRLAVAAAPQFAEAHYRLGAALLALEQWAEALAAYRDAFERDPAGALDRRELFLRLGNVELPPMARYWHDELVRFFARDDVDRSRYATFALRLLMQRPAFALVREVSDTDSDAVPLSLALDEVMGDELFGVVLRNALVAQAEYEQMLTRIRARLLLDRRMATRAPLDFVCRLAQQCFNNEYVYAESPQEQVALAALAHEVDATIEAGCSIDEPMTRQLATLALYRRLADVDGASSLRCPPTMPDAFRQLWKRTVDEVADERRLRTAVPVLGPSSDAVSRAVRAQYEENPYPRWLSFDRMRPTSISTWLALEVPGPTAPEPFAESFPAPFDMLVAGCGTGMETLGFATWLPDARVTAVDLSTASLAYATRMAAKLGITNVDFHHADILELGRLPQRFDMVYCAGVLMAMADPASGLRVLGTLLRPGGLIKLGIYSRRARWAVNIARELIRERGLAATPAAMREFRQEVFDAESGSPLRSLRQWRDFYSMSDTRDMLFHVQEHQFDLPGIEALAHAAGLEVLGLSRQLPRHAIAAYRQTFPGLPVSAEIARWNVVEQRYPDTFVGMYQVWLRKPA